MVGLNRTCHQNRYYASSQYMPPTIFGKSFIVLYKINLWQSISVENSLLILLEISLYSKGFFRDYCFLSIGEDGCSFWKRLFKDCCQAPNKVGDEENCQFPMFHIPSLFTHFQGDPSSLENSSYSTYCLGYFCEKLLQMCCINKYKKMTTTLTNCPSMQWRIHG